MKKRYFKKGLQLLTIILTLVCFFPDPTSAEKNLKKEYERIQREIKKKREALKKTVKRERSILQEIEALNIKLEKLKSQIKKQKKKIYKIERELYSLNKEIRSLSAKLQLQQRWLKRKIVAMQRYGYTSAGRFITREAKEINPLMLLVTSEDIPQFIRRWHYLKSIAEYEYTLMNEYENNLTTLQSQKQRHSELLKSLKKEQKKLLKKEAELRHQKRKKRQLLASIRKERELYKKMLAELKESSRKLRRIIIESEKKKFALKGFSKMKRRLPWPVKGRLALPYGSYVDPKFKTPVFRNGIHIKAREGETVRAVYAGKVVFADWFKGYGRVVIINHGEGYYTVYANLSEIFLSKGDIIKKGTPVGRVGESGTLNAPGLYFEVRYKGKPLNPLHWLRRRG